MVFVTYSVICMLLNNDRNILIYNEKENELKYVAKI